jgi:2-C-methyl-D-erythritol 2,4-cyclodiphosphate synthase
MRIGHGFDVHAFGEGSFIILGGVHIPHSQGIVAHSDGDLLLHAICDALLGAAGLGDIGWHFPDSNPEFKGVESRILLRRVNDLLLKKQLVIGNIDATIVAQSPRIGPYIGEMSEHIAADLGVSLNQVNVKATTTEHLGTIGRREGIAVHAVALIFTSQNNFV